MVFDRMLVRLSDNLTSHRLPAVPDLDKRIPFTPLTPTRNRAAQVSERIAAEIASGRFGPSARLPAEHELMAAMGVSRSVVREAVATLRSEGMVVTRQGAGAFVAKDATRVPFRIDPDGTKSIANVINIMELRLATEVEAAALAAERATAAGQKNIERALKKIDQVIRRDEAAIEEDFAFHRAIAAATGNPVFEAFLTFLGRHVIPRQHIRAELVSGADQRAYLEKIQREHQSIARAILDRDPQAARRAMRGHIENSLDRYRELEKRSPDRRNADAGRRKGSRGPFTGLAPKQNPRVP